MSDISDIMSLQSQAAPPTLHNESKAGKDKAEVIPMHEHVDTAIEGFLHAATNSNQLAIKDDAVAKSSQAVSNAAISELSEDFLKAQNLIEGVMSNPVSKADPTTVGSALAALADNIQKAFDAVQNETGNDFSNEHPTVSIGGGFVMDLISRTITFNISTLNEEINSKESSNEFIMALKNKDSNSRSIESLRDVLADIAKPPTELKQRENTVMEKHQAMSVLKQILKESSMFSSAYMKIDSDKALGLLY